MNFKRYQFLKGLAIDALKEQEKTHPEVEIPQDSLMLAYVGDALYSLYVRNKMRAVPTTKIRVLHDIVTEFICAKAQAQAMHSLEGTLNEAELAVVKRARNASVNVPKSASVQEYRMSTAFEALLGYLYCEGQDQRLQECMDRAFQETLSQL